jgi:hypothetical protein
MKKGRREPRPATSQQAYRSAVYGIASLILFVTGIPAIFFGWLGLKDIRLSKGRLSGKGLARTGIVTGSIGTFLGIVVLALLWTRSRTADNLVQQSVETQKKMKEIGRASHVYHDRNKRYPPSGAEGGQTPALSWRVRLLPYLGQQELYDRFDLTQPWDSSTNAPLSNSVVPPYQTPGATKLNETCYLAPTGEGTIYPPGPQPPLRLGELPPGRIVMVEANPKLSTIWSKPQDWHYDPKDPKAGLGGLRPGGFLVLNADGSVEFLSQEIPGKFLSRRMGFGD